MDENMKRIIQKTIPALCEFIERTCEGATSETELAVLPEVVNSLACLMQTIR